MSRPTCWGPLSRGPVSRAVGRMRNHRQVQGSQTVRSSCICLMPRWRGLFPAPGDGKKHDELVGGRLSPRQQEAELIVPGPGLSSWPPQQRSTPVWLAPAPRLGAAPSQRCSARTAHPPHRAQVAGVAAASPPGERVDVQATGGATQSCLAEAAQALADPRSPCGHCPSVTWASALEKPKQEESRGSRPSTLPQASLLGG